MAHTATYQEPYTQYPNRYNDVIKPQLTDTERDVCDVVIRQTYGWHQTDAAISNALFAQKSNKSVQGIIKAKNQLEEIGLLIILEKGGGSKTGVYMLDLHYDDPERSVRASMLRQEEQLLEIQNSSLPKVPEEQEDVPELLETPTVDEPIVAESTAPQTEKENPLVEPKASIEEESPLDEEDILCEEDIPASPETLDIEGSESPPEPEIQSAKLETPPSEENSASTEDISNPKTSAAHTGISDTAEGENPIIIEDFSPATPKLSLPPYINSNSNSNNISKEEKKQTIGPNDTNKLEEDTEKRRAAANVRYKFFSIFPESQVDNDWAFFGWTAKTYGVEVCMEKLDYMGEHRKQHPITNPKGFFRSALDKDYQPPASIATKIKADEGARRAIERSQREREEWDKTVSDFNYESAAASIQKLLDTLN